LVGLVVGSHGDTSINDWDVMKVLGVELINKVSKALEVDWVVGEVLVVVQIVNIRPLGIEEQVELRVVSNNLFDCVEGLVAPSALTPTESPLRCSNWEANDTVVSHGEFIRIDCEEEEHVTCASGCFCIKMNIASCWVVLHGPVLSCSIVLEDTEPCVVCSLGHVEWMNTVHVLAWKFSSLNWVSNISAPKSINTVGQEEIVGDLFKEAEDTLKIGWICVNLGVNHVEVFAECKGVEVPDLNT